jgi:hypothetical protein
MTIRTGLWLLAAALIFGAGWWVNGVRHGLILQDHLKNDAINEREAANRELGYLQEIRRTEKASQEKAERLAEAYEQDKKNAQESNDRLISDLRTGNVKLHSRWQACIATDRLSEAARSASSADDGAADREASAARAIAAARAADDQIRGLQAYARELSK